MSLFKDYDYRAIYLRSYDELKTILDESFRKGWRSFNFFLDRSSAPKTWKGRLARRIPPSLFEFSFENRITKQFVLKHRFICSK